MPWCSTKADLPPRRTRATAQHDLIVPSQIRRNRKVARTYAAATGKAKVTGYCIRFKGLAGINAEALHAAIRHGMTVQQAG